MYILPRADYFSRSQSYLPGSNGHGMEKRMGRQVDGLTCYGLARYELKRDQTDPRDMGVDPLRSPRLPSFALSVGSWMTTASGKARLTN